MATTPAAASRMDQHDEEDMEQPIADHLETHDAACPARAREELRNAKALADKLQTLLDSKTHQVEALLKEASSLALTLEVAREGGANWKSRAEKAERLVAATAGVLIQHANGDFLIGDPNTEDLARHIVAKLEGLEPDMDTVPLQALLEAVGTFLEADQAITIRGSFEATADVDISALGRTFRVPTYEASEALTNLHALAQFEIVEIGQ
jgi:hypothetical protein